MKLTKELKDRKLMISLTPTLFNKLQEDSLNSMKSMSLIIIELLKEKYTN
jgi:hypothetical protein